uniref:CAPP1 n=1 Tax=Arundo donax TaxID=35708 RepID=A0A0A9CU71_ARUDO
MKITHSSTCFILRSRRCSPDFISSKGSLNLSLKCLIKLLFLIWGDVLCIKLS